MLRHVRVAADLVVVLRLIAYRIAHGAGIAAGVNTACAGFGVLYLFGRDCLILRVVLFRVGLRGHDFVLN